MICGYLDIGKVFYGISDLWSTFLLEYLISDLAHSSAFIKSYFHWKSVFFSEKKSFPESCFSYKCTFCAGNYIIFREKVIFITKIVPISFRKRFSCKRIFENVILLSLFCKKKFLWGPLFSRKIKMFPLFLRKKKIFP